MSVRVAVIPVPQESLKHVKCKACAADGVESQGRAGVWAGAAVLFLCAGCLQQLGSKIREAL